MKLILDKILNQLRNPYKIFQKFYEFYFFFRYKIFYNESLYIKNQNILFEKNLLNRKTGLNKIKYIKTKYPFLNSPMSSEHQVIFSSLSKKKNFKKILEIGTFDGTNAFLLSKLFPKSKITTIDLEDSSEEFAESYGRFNYNKRKIFCKKRNAILAKSKNIKFIQKNSLYLTFSKNKIFQYFYINKFGLWNNQEKNIDSKKTKIKNGQTGLNLKNYFPILESKAL